ncbi:MAG: hypothetical protein NZT92_09610 [Abditibacteriales bacterium]|nr:hypothetical protein [Abditibacteriales bacterium]
MRRAVCRVFILVGLMLGVSKTSTHPSERQENADAWIPLTLRWLNNQKMLYAIPADHPRMRDTLITSIEKEANIAKALAAASRGRWVQIGDVLALVPGWLREPTGEELEGYTRKYHSTLEFLKSLSLQQRDALKGGGVLPLSSLMEDQLSLLKKSFEERYGRDYKPIEQLMKERKEGDLLGIRIVLWPGIRMLLDGIEQPCINFMWPLWKAEFYDRWHFVTLDDQTGKISPWGLENLLPETMRGYDLPDPTAATPLSQKSPTPRLDVEQSKRITLQEGRAYTLKELAERVRGKTNVELWVDRQIASVRILLSKGTYPVDVLLNLCRKCYGLQSRRVGEITFLTQGFVPLTQQRSLEGWELHLLSLPLLTWVDEGVHYPGIGFPIESYLQRKRMQLSSLSPPERAFVENAWWVTRNWNDTVSRSAYGYLLGRYQTAEKYYRYYGATASSLLTQSDLLSGREEVEMILEPLHTIMVVLYQPSDFITRMREQDPDLKDRDDLPKTLYEINQSILLSLWPAEFSLP